MPESTTQLNQPTSDRAYWVELLEKLARPVFSRLADGTLKQSLPQAGPQADRHVFAPLQAYARTLCGVAPWLETPHVDPNEEKLRLELVDLARAGLARAVDPASPDFMHFSEGRQRMVDTALLCQGLMRAPVELWEKVDRNTRRQTVEAVQSARCHLPHFSNWLLFGAMPEAFLATVGAEWDRMRIDYALRQHEQWYLGNGTYNDGLRFTWDYYNSFIIHPMLLDVARLVGHRQPEWEPFQSLLEKRAAQYAGMLEQLISPEATFPAIGRSITYRCGVFHALSQAALMENLPEGLPPSQVRSALTAVYRRLMAPPETFDDKGWLRIGFCGDQPNLAEGYIDGGSIYFCATGLVALGLPESHEFWSGPRLEWTSQKMWSGQHCERVMRDKKAPDEKVFY